MKRLLALGFVAVVTILATILVASVVEANNERKAWRIDGPILPG